MKATLLLLALVAGAEAARARGCPLHTVLGLLDKMNAKINAEGAEADKVQKEKAEWCRSTKQETEHSLGLNKDAIEKYSAGLAKANANIESFSSSISELAAQITRESAEKDKATALRKQQNEDFLAGQGDIEGTIDQLVRANGLLRKAGLGDAGAGLMQVTKIMTTVLDAAFINADDRSKLQSLLQAASGDDDEGYSQPQGKVYESHSASIIDLIEELKVKAEAELSDLRKEEMDRQHAFDMLKQALTDSVNTGERDRKNDAAALKENEEGKAKNSGDLAEEQEAKSNNDAFLADTTAECQKAADDHAASSKSRAEELAALAQAEEILRDAYKGAVKEFKAGGTHQEADDELPGFLQILSPREDARSKAVKILRDLGRKFRDVALAQVASRAGDDTFGKVKGLIRTMIAKLKKKAAQEAEHNAYCESEKKDNSIKRDDQQRKLDGFAARLEKAKAGQADLKNDIATLGQELADLSSAMAEATKVREQESSDFGHNAEGFRIATEGLSKAIGVLREYYAAEGSHDKKTDSSSGIVAMLETLLQDVSNCQAQAEIAETNAQQSYDKMMQGGKVSKAEKTANSKAKTAELARLDELTSDLSNDVDGAQAELDATLQYLSKLKNMCTHKPQTFEDRAAARQAEIAGLKQALEILESETSFMQA